MDDRPVCLLVLTILATGLIKHCALAVRSTYRLHFCRRYVCDRCTAITQSCVGLTLVFLLSRGAMSHCHTEPCSQPRIVTLYHNNFSLNNSLSLSLSLLPFSKKPVAPCVPPETEADPVQRLFCQLNLAFDH